MQEGPSGCSKKVLPGSMKKVTFPNILPNMAHFSVTQASRNVQHKNSESSTIFILSPVVKIFKMTHLFTLAKKTKGVKVRRACLSAVLPAFLSVCTRKLYGSYVPARIQWRLGKAVHGRKVEAESVHKAAPSDNFPHPEATTFF